MRYARNQADLNLSEKRRSTAATPTWHGCESGVLKSASASARNPGSKRRTRTSQQRNKRCKAKPTGYLRTEKCSRPEQNVKPQWVGFSSSTVERTPERVRGPQGNRSHPVGTTERE